MVTSPTHIVDNGQTTSTLVTPTMLEGFEATGAMFPLHSCSLQAQTEMHKRDVKKMERHVVQVKKGRQTVFSPGFVSICGATATTGA